MNDAEILETFGRCHNLATDLGIKITTNSDGFSLHKNGVQITKKVKLNNIHSYLEGYREAISNN